MEKIGLVLEGGGVRGAYTAGALAWLNDNHVTFDYNVGISSGAVYLACYMVNDTHTPKNMSIHYASGKDVVGFAALRTEGHYVALRKIFEHYLSDTEHMDVSDISKKNLPVEVGAYILEDGKTEYYGAKDINMTLLRGTCALPCVAETVVYQGRHLLDGGITKMIPIERAQEQGCTKYVVITTKPADYVRKPSSKIETFVMKHMYKNCAQISKDYAMRHLNYYHQIDIIDQLIKEGKCIQILPTEDIEVSRYHGDVENTTRLYDLGYQDMEARRQEILHFIDHKSE
jgi:predicted patatin/cPLA2 family phospholipase